MVLGDDLRHLVDDPADVVVAGGVDRGDPPGAERLGIVQRDDAADHYRHVDLLQDFGYPLHVGAGQDRQAHQVDVFLLGGLCDLVD